MSKLPKHQRCRQHGRAFAHPNVLPAITKRMNRLGLIMMDIKYTQAGAVSYLVFDPYCYDCFGELFTMKLVESGIMTDEGFVRMMKRADEIKKFIDSIK